MRFALLDPDADALALAVALVRESGHELTAYVSTFADPIAALAELAPEAAHLAEWEGVLAGPTQAVVVGTAGPAEQRFEQLRRLVLENVPLVFVHPFSLASLEYHELDMNRQATGSAIVSYEPTREHPAVAAIALTAAVGHTASIGRIHQIVFERQAKVRTRSASLTHFARDIGLIRRQAGPCEKVSALGRFTDDAQTDATAPSAAAAVGRLSVQSTGQLGVQCTTTDGVLIRWSIDPVVDTAGAKMTIVGSDGNLILTMPASGPWTLQTRRGDASTTETATSAAATTEPATTEAFPGTAAGSAAQWIPFAIDQRDDRSWREALADLELVEAVERSMRRGRTVELYHEEASEQGTFHGVMAAVGCLLIMLAIGLAITASIFGTFRLWIANLWPYALLALLVVFLLMQLLKFVFPTKPTDDE